MIFISQNYTDIGAIEADSKEEALLKIWSIENDVNGRGAVHPKSIDDIETLDEFVQRALQYWKKVSV